MIKKYMNNFLFIYLFYLEMYLTSKKQRVLGFPTASSRGSDP